MSPPQNLEKAKPVTAPKGAPTRRRTDPTAPTRALFARECARAWRGGGGSAASAAFFFTASALTAFALGPDTQLLASAAPGALVLALAIAALLGLEHMFQEDLEIGAADQLALAAAPLEFVAFTKIVARAVAGMGLAVVVAPLAAMLFVAPDAVGVWAAPVAAVAAPGLIGAGATPAALAAGAARGGLLIAVLTPPLMAPTAIFAALALRAAAAGDDVSGLLSLLAASSLASVVIGAFGAAAAFRIHLE